MSYSLEGKRVVITGGASGIGAATAQLFAAHGARIALGYNSDPAKAEQVVAGLAGDGHFPVRMTIDDGDSLAGAAGKIAETFGAVDVLVNSAGRTVPIPAMGESPSVEGWAADLTGDGKDEIVLVYGRPPGGRDRVWLVRP